MGQPQPIEVTLLGFTVPDQMLDEIIASDPIMPVQTHTFAWALVKSLRAVGCRVRLVSAAPVSSYPANRRVLFRGGRFRQAGADGRLLGFVNVLGLKHLTRFVSARRAVAETAGVLLIHGVHAPFLWCGALAARTDRKVVPVLTDPPGVALPTDGRVVRLLRRIDVALVRAALRHCSGVIALTGALADDFAPGLPHLVMEGICDPVYGAVAVDSGPGREVIYAGGLTRAYGVDRLVAAFRALPDPDLRLRVFGRGELAEWVCAQAREDSRIAPPEMLPREALAGRLSRAAVLVNPRPVDQSFVRHSFPSKLLEYLSVGVPVVTTRLPAISAAYDPYLVYAEPDTVDGLRDAMARVVAMPTERRRELGQAGAAFVRDSRGPAAQGARIAAFLAGLAGANGPANGRQPGEAGDLPDAVELGRS